MSSHFISILLLGFLLFCTSDKLRACTTSISPPHYIVQSAEVIVRATAEELIENQGVKFKVTEVIKGTDVPPVLIIRGSLSEKDEFNRGTVPYWNAGRSTGGLCYSYSYKKGGEFLLLLKKYKDELTPYWRSLAPVNEQLRSSDDEWLKWVKGHLHWVENATELQKVELTFELFRKMNLNTEAELLWRYHFIDSSEKKLQQLAKRLESLGYTFVKIMKAENKVDSEEFELQVEKIEKRSPTTLIQINEELTALTNEFGGKNYWWNASSVK